MQNFDYQNLLSILSLIIAFMALVQSHRSSNRTYELNHETKQLAYRTSFAKEFSDYIKTLSEEFVHIEDRLSTLSTHFCETNRLIGEAFDRHAANRTVSGQHPRHIYNNLHNEIKDKYKRELHYQTPENIYFNLATIKQLNPEFDLVKTDEPFLYFFTRKKIDFGLSPITSERFSNNFIEIHKVFDTDSMARLHRDFTEICSTVVAYLEESIPACKKSYDSLYKCGIRNGLEEFSLTENQNVYWKYIQFKNLMNFLIKCRIQHLPNKTSTPFLPISDILFYGAEMNMLNELICDTSFKMQPAYV